MTRKNLREDAAFDKEWAKKEWAKSLLLYMHPVHTGARDCTNVAKIGGGQHRESVHEWQEAFCSLYYMYRHRMCRYFYIKFVPVLKMNLLYAAANFVLLTQFHHHHRHDCCGKQVSQFYNSLENDRLD